MKKLVYSSLVFTALFGFVPVATFASDTNIEKISIGRICSGGATTCEANGDSLDTAISQDGRFVSFISFASNLISGSTSGGWSYNTFVFDKTIHAVSGVNVSPNDLTITPELSDLLYGGNRKFVVFASTANNLVPNDTNSVDWHDIFVQDIENNTIERVNLSPDGAQMIAGECYHPTISENGRYVAFSCYKGALFFGSPEGVYLRDRLASTTTFIVGGVERTNTGNIAMTRDGRYIVYNQGPDNGTEHNVFVKDFETGVTQKVSVASDGTDGNGDSSYGAISDDGRYITFYSDATNLVLNDTNGVGDGFVHDMITGQTARISETNGVGGNLKSRMTRNSISGDGKYIVFDSWATNLGPWVDTNTHHDGSSGFDVFLATNPLFVSNNAPVFDPIGSQQVDENQPLQFSVFATDLDSDTVTLSSENLPIGATFDSLTGSFSWTPDYNQVGDYTVRFIATDDGLPIASSTLNVLITVSNVNRAPVLDPIGDKMTDENQTLQFAVSATDPDGDALSYSASNLPAGAAFNPATGIFSWTPSYGQAGNYTNVEFTATDNGSPMQLDTKLITITVNDINRPPVFTAIGSQEVPENQPLTFTISATDPDSNSFVLSAANLPIGSTFNSSTGVFSWTPDFSQAGTYVVDFTATDNGTPTASSILQVVITVGDVPTPTEQAGNLIDIVVDYNFPTAVENSYLANLRKVPKFIEEGKITSAINQLDAFIQKVQQDLVSGLISQATADELIALANALKSDLSN